MERGNSKHSPLRDDELAQELEGTLRSTKSPRAEEWREAEPPAEDGEMVNETQDRVELPPKEPQPDTD